MKFKNILILTLFFFTLISLFIALNKNYKHSLFIDTRQLGDAGERTFFKFTKDNTELFKNVKIKFSGNNIVEFVKLTKNKINDKQLLKIQGFFRKNSEYSIKSVNKIKSIFFILMYFIIIWIFIKVIADNKST